MAWARKRAYLVHKFVHLKGSCWVFTCAEWYQDTRKFEGPEAKYSCPQGSKNFMGHMFMEAIDMLQMFGEFLHMNLFTEANLCVILNVVKMLCWSLTQLEVNQRKSQYGHWDMACLHLVFDQSSFFRSEHSIILRHWLVTDVATWWLV